MSKIKSIPAWVWRKALYGVVFLVSGILGYFGILSQIQADQVMEQVDKWLPILASMIGSGTAFIKTHAGSDSTATDEDRVISQSYPPADLTDQVRDAAERAVRDAVARIPGADQVASAVLAAIRAEERGEHDTVTDPTVAGAAAAAAATDYVYGR